METQYDYGLYHNMVEYGYEVLRTLDPKTRTNVIRKICKITSRDAHPTI
jgi:hypothetical protein